MYKILCEALSIGILKKLSLCLRDRFKAINRPFVDISSSSSSLSLSSDIHESPSVVYPLIFLPLKYHV